MMSGNKNNFNIKELAKLLLSKREAGVFIAFIIISVFFIIQSPAFLTSRNLLNVMRQTSQLGIVVAFVTILIISSEFDLSVGAVFAFSGVFMGFITTELGLTPWVALPLSILVCSLFGLVNGTISVYLKVPSFITTLGTSMVIRGLALYVSGGRPVSGNITETFYLITGGRLWNFISSPILWFLGAMILGGFILQKTVFGYMVFATGGNEKAAHFAGIPTKKIKIIAFVLTAAAAALSGGIALSYLGSATPTQGTGMELDAIAATVIGGTALMGGSGSMLGAFLGVLIMAIVRNGLVLLGAGPFMQDLLIGIIIVFAVIINVQLLQRSE